MKKFFAWLILSVVILQAFFVPVFADEEEPQYEAVSLWDTTIFQDFGVSSVSQLHSALGLGFASDPWSFGYDLSDKYEIVNAAIEESSLFYRVYLYVMNRACVSRSTPFAWDLDGSDVATATSDRVWALPDHSVYKVAFHVLKTDTAHYSLEGDQLSITVYSIGRMSGDVYESNSAFYEEYVGGSCSSYLTLNFDLSTSLRGASDDIIQLQSVAAEKKLKLNVSMMSERFSSPIVDSFYQLNTAAFIIPNSYFEEFGSLRSVMYSYDLYDKVPMLVLPKSEVSVSLVEDYFNPLDDNFDFYPTPVPYVNNSNPNSSPFDGPYTVGSELVDPLENRFRVGLNDPYVPAYLPTFYDYAKYFTFLVDSISDPGEYDFSGPDALSRFKFYKEYYSSSLTSSLKASSFDHVERELTPDHVWSTLSYDDASSWFDKLIDYGVWSFWPFYGTIEDDSLDDVEAISLVESDPGTLSDTEFRQTWYVDPIYKSVLHDLYLDAVSSNGSLVILRYSLTDYVVHNIDNYLCEDFSPSIGGISGYVCENAVIDNFDILRIYFHPTSHSADGPSLHRTYELVPANPGGGSDLPEGGDVLDHSGDVYVDVDMDPVPFIEGGQSSNSIMEPLITRFNYIKSRRWLMIFIIILCAVVVLWLLSKILKLIALFRDAFGRRTPYDRWDVGKRRK